MSPNGKRANRAMRAIEAFTDCNFRDDGDAGLRTDMSDLIADLHHLADACDIPWSDLLEHAERGHAGDSEDGPPATRAELEPTDLERLALAQLLASEIGPIVVAAGKGDELPANVVAKAVRAAAEARNVLKRAPAGSDLANGARELLDWLGTYDLDARS